MSWTDSPYAQGAGQGAFNALSGYSLFQLPGLISKGLGEQVPGQPGQVNLSQLSAGDTATQQQLLAAFQAMKARQAGTFAGQNQLAGSLQGTIAGTTPSVALAQLGQGQDAIARQQLSQAAGVGGANAAAARLAAAANTANSQAQGNQAAALLRAQEIAAAQQNLGALYNSQLTAENAANQTNVGGAANFAKTAEGAGSTNQQLSEQANEFNAKQTSDTVGQMGNGLTKLAAFL